MIFEKKQRTERVIQFGEGGFLRGFVDWMLQKVNENSDFDGSVVVVQPIEQSIKESFFANKMFFSAKGITKEIGILESNEQECAIKQCMLANSESKYFLCDSGKIGRVSFAKLASLGEIDYVITDKEPDEELSQALKDNNVCLITE